jgi:hypothetical protein
MLMDKEIQLKIQSCERAENAEWEEVVAVAEGLDETQKAFLREHPPGLVMALWSHFEATRGQCGCNTPAHERPGCTVRLIERLLLDEQSV